MKVVVKVVATTSEKVCGGESDMESDDELT